MDPFPEFIEPQLATLVEEPPPGPEWLHEVKYDGYRTLCRIAAGSVRLLTRRRADLTTRLQPLAAELARLPLHQAWLDGELVVLLPGGVSSFQALQGVFREGRRETVRYMVFDLLHLDGRDLRGEPLAERKRLLASLLPPGELVRYVDHLVGEGEEFFRQACRLTLEGIVCKRADAPYLSGRGRSWMKVKCRRSAEFVVGGYTESTRGNEFGSILVGEEGAGGLLFRGKVGTGFGAAGRGRILAELREAEAPEPPFAHPPSGPEYRNPHWLRPLFTARVEYTEVTNDGLLRHASFRGLRRLPQEATPFVPQPGEVLLPVLPDSRIIYPHERFTMADVREHYRRVALRMLPHVTGRPLTLVLCPNNVKACRYKKHATRLPPQVRRIAVPGHREAYIMIEDEEALLALAEVGMVEVHTWGAPAATPEVPDKLVFDLDPAEGVGWEALVEGVLLVRERLLALGLVPFLKTTGGKGYHVVAPLLPRFEWSVVTPFARELAEELARRHPALLTSHHRMEPRQGRIFVDWMRNGRGTNAVEAYSLRGRHGAGVAMPLFWEELARGVRPDAFALPDVAARLVEPDPWETFFSSRRPLPR